MDKIIKKFCTDEWVKFIHFHSIIYRFNKDEIIFKVEDDVAGVYFINFGKFKVVKGAKKSERIIRLASEEDVLGHRGVGGTWKYTVSVIALELTEVVFIPIKMFNQAIKANPEFGFFVLMFFADELRDSEDLAQQRTVKSSIALSLMKNLLAFGYDGKSDKLSYSLARKDLASMAGTTYESTVRSLADLHKEGVIEIDGKTINILDEKALNTLAISN